MILKKLFEILIEKAELENLQKYEFEFWETLMLFKFLALETCHESNTENQTQYNLVRAGL